MAWEVWWALILGFALSGVVQAWVTRGQMERLLGGRGLAATLKATGLGAASSSCSYAAIAIAKSTFQKGAGLPAAIAFMFASTNLVFEIGIVLWIFLGPEFTAAEFAGGLLLILLMWVGVRLFVSAREEQQVREHARRAQTGHQHAIASGRRTLRQKLGLGRGLVGRRAQLPRRLADALEGGHDRLPDRRLRRPAAGDASSRPSSSTTRRPL